MEELSGFIQALTVVLIPGLVAITFHEAAHGYVAQRLGDNTAYMLGRVTFNPLKHIDPFGTIILPLLMFFTTGFLFGWAKPVPVDFRNLRDPKRDMIWVALAGPGVNIFLALMSAFLLHTVPLMPEAGQEWYHQNLLFSVQINVLLAVFNMLPLPPLDGGRVVTGILPGRLSYQFAGIERYGMLILLAAVFLIPFTAQQLGYSFNPLFYVLLPPMEFVTDLIVRVAGLT